MLADADATMLMPFLSALPLRLGCWRHADAVLLGTTASSRMLVRHCGVVSNADAADADAMLMPLLLGAAASLSANFQ